MKLLRYIKYIFFSLWNTLIRVMVDCAHSRKDKAHVKSSNIALAPPLAPGLLLACLSLTARVISPHALTLFTPTQSKHAHTHYWITQQLHLLFFLITTCSTWAASVGVTVACVTSTVPGVEFSGAADPLAPAFPGDDGVVSVTGFDGTATGVGCCCS